MPTDPRIGGMAATLPALEGAFRAAPAYDSPDEALVAALEEDEEVRLLAGHLALCDGVLVAVAQVASPVAAGAMLAALGRLVPKLDGRTPRVKRLEALERPATWPGLARDVIQPLMDLVPPASQGMQENQANSTRHGSRVHQGQDSGALEDRQALVVVDASAAMPMDLEAWRLCFQRLNELRNDVLRRLPGPLLLLLPPALFPEFAWHAPDFWSVRTVSVRPAPPAMAPLDEATLDRLGRRDSLDYFETLSPGERRQLEQALEESGRRLQAAPGNPDLQRLRASLLAHKRDHLHATGALAEALAHAQEVVRLREVLHRQAPARQEWQWDLAIALRSLGDLRREQGDLAGAETSFLNNLALSEALHQHAPESPQARRDLALALGRLGDLRREQGDLAGAEAYFQKCIDLFEALHQHAPESPQARRDLAIALERLGDLRHVQGDLAGAEAYHGKSLALREALHQHAPESPKARRDLAFALGRLGDLREAQGDIPGAIALYERSLPLTEALARDCPDVPRYQEDLRITRRRLDALRTRLAPAPGDQATAP